METEKKTHSFFLRERKDLLLEALFHSFWENLKPGTVLNTPGHEQIRILSPGIWNRGKEPDFRSGNILFRGKELHGDIMLHENASDYIKNGHLFQSSCTDVILHVFTRDDVQRSGKGSNSSMSHILECILPREILFSREFSGERCRFFPCMSKNGLREFFLEAGREHLQQKSLVILEEMIRDGIEKTFGKTLLLASGNKYNKEAFRELCRRLHEYEKEYFHKHYKTLLWGESSLLPDVANSGLPEENRALARKLWDDFWLLRKSSREKIPWNTGRIRPFNFPERRIAMLCGFFDKFTVSPLESFADELLRLGGTNFLRKMKKELLLSDPFWDRHCSFHSLPMKQKASILGPGQAETLLFDAIIPSLLALGKLRGNAPLERAASSLTEELGPRKDLPQFRKALAKWFPGRDGVEKIFDNGCLTQGVLYMSSTFCTEMENTSDCLHCPLQELQKQ